MAAPTSTGIGQGSAQIIDLSQIDKQIQQGYGADVALARKNKEDKDAFVGKQAENLKAITKAKIYTKHIPEFKKKSEELWKYVKDNASNFKDPNVEAELMQRMGQLLREAEASEQTEKNLLDEAKFIRERGGERFVKGADKYNDFINNPIDENGNLKFYQPSVSKYDPPSYPDSINKYAKLIGTVESGGSSMFTNKDGVRGTRTTNKKTANWQSAISAVNEDYLTSEDARELYDRVYKEVPDSEKKQLAKMGIDNPVAYTAYRAGQTKDVGETSSISNIKYGDGEEGGDRYSIQPQVSINLKTTDNKGGVMESTAILQNSANFPNAGTTKTASVNFKNASKPNEIYKNTDILTTTVGQIALAPVYKKGLKVKGLNTDVSGQIVPTARLEENKGAYEYIPVVFGKAKFTTDEDGESAAGGTSNKEPFDFYAPASEFKGLVPSKLYKQYETVSEPTQPKAGNRTPQVKTAKSQDNNSYKVKTLDPN